ncbi:AAA family ATPase [Kocuria sp.]|uniref:AAA family ATPase n=1 Tax=Kocuria sp. TaxID=1871328 RepID=UPI0026DFF41D|nr:AAA family ATPase [Kocuria sp.]MDO5617219.1 AAA family ATPase [Kocuria sp.]
MRLHSIELTNFKGVENRRVDFAEHGVTVLVGQNETGKSSVIEALDLLLDQLPTAKNKHTKAARPQGRDVGVAVEAELTLDNQRLRYGKRWWLQPGAELEYLSGPKKGHKTTGREAHDAVRQLMERSDLTLWHALRVLQSGHRAQDFKGSASLRRALEAGSETTEQDDSSSLTVLQAAQAERAKYFTEQGREKSDTAALRRRFDQAVQRVDSAQAELDRITQSVAAFDRAAADTQAARETDKRAREDLAHAETAAAEVEQLRNQRTHAEQELEQVQLRTEHSRAEWTARQVLVQEVQAARELLTELEASLAEQSGAAAQADELAAQARRRLGRDRDSELAARRREKAARAAERQASDAHRLAELETVARQLDELRAEAATLSTYQVSGITTDQVEALDRAQRAVELAQTQLDAGSAQVTLTALHAETTVTVEGIPTTLDPQHPVQRAVTEPLLVELPDHLQILVEPEDGLHDRRATVEAAQDAMDALLAAAGVDSRETAHRHHQEDRQHADTLASWEQRRALVLRGQEESALRSEIASLRGRTTARATHGPHETGQNGADTGAATAGHTDVESSTGTAALQPVSASDLAATTDEQEVSLLPLPEGADPEALRVAVASAEADWADAQDAVTRSEQVFADAEKSAQQAQLVLAQARTHRDSTQHRQKELTQRLTQARQDKPDGELEKTHHAQLQHLDQLRAHRDRLEAQWSAGDADGVLLQARGHRQRVATAKDTLEAARATQSRAEGALEGLNRDAMQREFDSALTQRDALDRELTSYLRRAAAAKLLADTLEHFQAEAHRKYNAPFRHQLEQLGRTVFGPTFQVELADDLTITRRSLHGTWLDVTALSTGAQEQLDVLIRLAVATLVDANDGVPVVLDDTLGHSDPGRLISMAAALQAAGSVAQVILLTATPDRFAALQAAKTIRIQDDQ